MTPRRLDVHSVLAKLQVMRSLLERLAKLRDVTAEELVRDPDSRLITERIISQLVDLAVAINTQVAAAELNAVPDDYRRSFGVASQAGVISEDLADALAPSTGLRNIIVHAYLDLDLGRVAASVPLALDQYAEYVRQVAQWLRERPDLAGPPHG